MIFLLLERGIERPHRTPAQEGFANFLHRDVQLLGDVFGIRDIGPLLLQQTGDLRYLVEQSDLVQWQSDSAGLLSQGLENSLPDPPHRVRDELEPLLLVEPLGRRNQTHVAGTDEIGERDTAVLVFLGDADDEPQVGLDEPVAGPLVTLLDLARQVDLFR